MLCMRADQISCIFLLVRSIRTPVASSTVFFFFISLCKRSHSVSFRKIELRLMYGTAVQRDGHDRAAGGKFHFFFSAEVRPCERNDGHKWISFRNLVADFFIVQRICWFYCWHRVYVSALKRKM